MPAYPLIVDIQPSRILRLALLGAHLLAALAAGLADLALPAQGLLWLAVLAGAAWTLRPQATTRLRLLADGGLEVADTRAGWRPARALPGGTVTASLCVLRYRIEDERGARALILLPDSLAAEPFRALRLWLRWKIDHGLGARPERGPVQSGP